MQKGFATILILLAMLVVSAGLIGGAYYIGTKRPIAVVPSPTIQPTSTPSPTDETLTWKTYTLKDLTFKTPQGWSIVTIQDKDGSLVGYSINPSPLPIPSDVTPELSLSVHNNVKLEDKKQEKIKYTYLVNVITKDVFISNVSGVVLEGVIKFPQGVDAPLPEGEIDRSAFFQKGNELYVLNQTGEKYSSIFSQILSTFKFTDQNTGTRKACLVNADCPNGDSCSVWGPVRPDGQNQKYCTAPGQVAPL